MEFKCYFCGRTEAITDKNSDRIGEYGAIINRYICSTCGSVNLDYETAEDIRESNLGLYAREKISIYLRNEYERRGRTPSDKQLTMENLRQIINDYHEKDAIEKMETALLNIDNYTSYIGAFISINLQEDYPYYHCFNQRELFPLLLLLLKSELIEGENREAEYIHRGLKITPNGYERLREIKRKSKDSRQRFVAMWLISEMNNVFDKAIKPAIEYFEDGATEPRFTALKIDNKEHTNDINDEIISEIRRSRFMVCDLTGYRGGVYWEAGFAYGLGLKVIYTCREDWLKTQELDLYDKEGKKAEIKQEGIHFDLEHRSRIPWNEDDLDGFKQKLTNKIKAVII